MLDSPRRLTIYDDSLLTIVAESDPPELRLVVSGELDASNVAASRAAQERVRSVLDRDEATREVIVDMRDVTFCGSEGLLMLLALEEVARRRGRRLHVRDPSPMVARLLDLVCLDRLLEAPPR